MKQLTAKRFRLLVSTGLLLTIGALLSGCNTDAPEGGAAKAPLIPAGTGGGPKSGGGNMIDTTADPAPPGVKTGIEGGKK